MAKQNKRDPRIKWDEAKEVSLLDIIENGENGQLKKVIKERATNIKLKYEDAWNLVTDLYNKTWDCNVTKAKIRKKYNNLLLAKRKKAVTSKGIQKIHIWKKTFF